MADVAVCEYLERQRGLTLDRCHQTGQTRPQKGRMIVLGVILLIIGLVASISILLTLGIILVVIGIFLELLGMAGHAVGGRRHYY
jgi:uncharacterized membrane protein HdeD (DUF308 family)